MFVSVRFLFLFAPPPIRSSSVPEPVPRLSSFYLSFSGLPLALELELELEDVDVSPPPPLLLGMNTSKTKNDRSEKKSSGLNDLRTLG